MSYRYLDSEFNSVQAVDQSNISEDVKYLNIECYDIADFVTTLLQVGKGFKINSSSDLYPRYFPPRYMVTLEKVESTLTSKEGFKSKRQKGD